MFSQLLQVTFIQLGTIITNGKELQSYIDTYNATWTYVGDDIFLEATNTTLVGGVLSVRRWCVCVCVCVCLMAMCVRCVCMCVCPTSTDVCLLRARVKDLISEVAESWASGVHFHFSR